jgi:NADPH:quinone reductase-like Zn-dependent oxidoreductase
MHAIVQDAYGDADVLQPAEIATPTPQDTEVLIEVRAAGLDRGTWHLMTGTPYLARVTGLRKPHSRVPGLDLAGVVTAVGSKVTEFRPGDEVYGNGKGSFAQFAVARPDRLAPKPASLSFEEAAVVPVSGATALLSLHKAGRVAAGQRVLILGASGGVGTYAAQIAKAAGAEVTAVCSAAKHDLVIALGADRVIDYAAQDALAEAGRYDLIIDIAGNAPVKRLRHALSERGTLVIVGGENGDSLTGGMHRQLGAVALSPFVGQRLTTIIGLVRSHDLRTLTDLIDAGSVMPVVDRVFPLAEAADAMRHLVAGNARGKIAISI